MKTNIVLTQIREESFNTPALAFPFYVDMPEIIFAGREFKNENSSGKMNSLYQLVALNQMEGLTLNIPLTTFGNFTNSKGNPYEIRHAMDLVREYESLNIATMSSSSFILNMDRITSWRLNFPVNALRNSNATIKVPMFLMFSKNVDLFLGQHNKLNTLLLYIIAKKSDPTHLTVVDIPVSLLSTQLFFPYTATSLDKKKDVINNLLSDLVKLNVIQDFSFSTRAKTPYVSFTFLKDETKYFVPSNEDHIKEFISRQATGVKTFLNTMVEKATPEDFLAAERIVLMEDSIEKLITKTHIIKASSNVLNHKIKTLSKPGDWLIKDYALQLEAWKEIKKLFEEGLIIKESKLATIYKLGIKDINYINGYDAHDAIKALINQFELNITRISRDLDKLKSGDYSPLEADTILVESILSYKDVEADIIERRRKRKNADFNQTILNKLSKKYDARRKELVRKNARIKNPYLNKADLDKKASDYYKEYIEWFKVD